jgi:hypothetical protein
LATAENYYSQLSSGDPTAIARAISPATQQISQQATGNAQRIRQDVPRGGQQNLALAENEISKGAQVGNLATSSYLNSFQNLAALSGQGIGEAGSFTNSAIGGLSAAGNQYSSIANQQAEGKATQLGFISSLAGSAAEAGAGFCWIAMALFGEDSYEVAMIRLYLARYASQHWFGRAMVSLYKRYGQWVAAHIRKSRVWRAVWTPVFEALYAHARRAVSDCEARLIFETYWNQHSSVFYHVN